MRKLTILAIAALMCVLTTAPAAADGPNKTPVAGTSTLTIVGGGDTSVTPGEVMHEFGGSGLLAFAGDLTGVLSLEYRGNSTMTSDMSVYVARAAQSGDLTWNGRTGAVSGIVTASCEFSLSLFAFWCSGRGVLHGAGDLDGVTFRTTWEGTFFGVGDFTYAGYAVDAHS